MASICSEWSLWCALFALLLTIEIFYLDILEKYGTVDTKFLSITLWKLSPQEFLSFLPLYRSSQRIILLLSIENMEYDWMSNVMKYWNNSLFTDSMIPWRINPFLLFLYKILQFRCRISSLYYHFVYQPCQKKFHVRFVGCNQSSIYCQSSFFLLIIYNLYHFIASP